MDIIKRIYDTYAKAKAEEKLRSHLGASSLGDKCLRHIYYEFRWYDSSKISPRILRLFETGKLEEKRIIRNLKKINLPVTGRQNSLRDVSGHIGGSVDGIIQLDEQKHILEVKTHSKKNFSRLGKQRLALAFPKHYAQVQIYMGLAKISKTFYLAVNKDNDELYSEIIDFDPISYDDIISKGREVLLATVPPDRIKDIPGWFECKMCKFYNICHQSEAPKMNCRSCVFSKPTRNGSWHCTHHDQALDHEAQLKGCSEYKLNH